MTKEELTEIEQRCERATPGPWIAVARHCHNDGDQDEMDGLGWDVDGPPDAMRGQYSRAGDAKFIALARQDIPLLLAEIRQMAKEKAG